MRNTKGRRLYDNIWTLHPLTMRRSFPNYESLLSVPRRDKKFPNHCVSYTIALGPMNVLLHCLSLIWIFVVCPSVWKKEVDLDLSLISRKICQKTHFSQEAAQMCSNGFIRFGSIIRSFFPGIEHRMACNFSCAINWNPCSFLSNDEDIFFGGIKQVTKIDFSFNSLNL